MLQNSLSEMTILLALKGIKWHKIEKNPVILESNINFVKKDVLILADSFTEKNTQLIQIARSWINENKNHKHKFYF